MERFLQEAQAQVPLVPITTDGVLRRSGLIGITYSPRRLVHLKDVNNLARVDTGQLPKNLQNQPGVTAYRFITSDYSSTISIETTSPRITVNQRWMLGTIGGEVNLEGRLNYHVTKVGIFEIRMKWPEPWRISNLGPSNLVETFEIKGKGPDRMLYILLKKETTGHIPLELSAHFGRIVPHYPQITEFILPTPYPENVRYFDATLLLMLPEHLSSEVLEEELFKPIPVKNVRAWTKMNNMSPAMSFHCFLSDYDKKPRVKFKITAKAPQVSAVVHRLVNIQPGSLDQEAVIDYRIRYAPVGTFYLKMPAELARKGVDITGANIKEKPRIDELPSELRGKDEKTEEEGIEWAYYKVVLQSKVIGSYQLKVRARRAFQAGQVGQATIVEVGPILAAGKLSDQSGHIAIAKAETLAIGEPVSKNLIPADAGSAADLPYQAHRRIASLAFKYNAPPFELSLPVVAQKEASVFTTIVSGAIIERCWPAMVCSTRTQSICWRPAGAIDCPSPYLRRPSLPQYC